jgi:NTE family protein
MAEKTEKYNLALVLSGGGARGMAHIGAIKVLEKNNIIPNIIIGTSTGAMVGGMYAAGELSNFENIIVKKTKKQINKILKIWPSKEGLIKTKELEKELRKIIGNRKIEELDKKFVALSVDLLTGKKIIIDNGDLCEAILASMAVPVLFPPRHKGEMLLVDGGLEDPVALDEGFKVAEKVIAINTIRDIGNFPKKENYSFADILERASAIMQDEIMGPILKKYKKNLVILNPLVNLDTLTFDKAKEAIAIGEAEAEKNIDKIKLLLGR